MEKNELPKMAMKNWLSWLGAAQELLNLQAKLIELGVVL